MSVWHIGVDGGGTRATAALADGDGAVFYREVGPAGIVRTDSAAAAAAVVAGLARTLLAKVGSARAATLCCGLAGAGRVAERDAVRAQLEAAGVAAHVLVVGDAEAAMADAFDGSPGVLLIAGTGSIAWATTPEGDAVRVGGWGQLLGDEGSGFAIGLAGLRAVVRAADGRDPPTLLQGELLSAAEIPDMEDLVRFTERAAKSAIGALAPAVIRCAAVGDPVAAAIRDSAVRELALLGATAARRAGLAEPRIALAGGLIAPGGVLRDALAAELRRLLPGIAILDTPVDAARGAIRMALRQYP
jgi:N-acetylglucosamine kinase-like BadF-type ATPase